MGAPQACYGRPMSDAYPRDLTGYRPNPPHADWPGGRRIALPVVVNYEGGRAKTGCAGGLGPAPRPCWRPKSSSRKFSLDSRLDRRGKQAIRACWSQVGQSVDASTGYGQGTFASKVEINGDSPHVTREVDGGLETVAIKLPAIVTTDLRLNDPRYPSLPNIMKAKSKPLATKAPADYGVDTAPRLETLKVAEPAKRQGGAKVGSVDELVAKLKSLGVVA